MRNYDYVPDEPRFEEWPMSGSLAEDRDDDLSTEEQETPEVHLPDSEPGGLVEKSHQKEEPKGGGSLFET